MLGDKIQTPEGTVDFPRLFLVPTGVALGAALILFLFFRPPVKSQTAPLVHEALAEDAWAPQIKSEGIMDPKRREGIVDP
jgi:hypothetical protein